MSVKIPRKTKAERASYEGKGKATRKVRGSAPKTTSSSNGNGKHSLTAYEHLHVGIVQASLKGKYMDANEEFCRIVGYSKEELLQLDIKQCTYEEDYALDIKLHEQLVAGKIPFYALEKRYVRKDGRLVWTELTRSLVRDENGRPLHTMGVVTDISEYKQVERVLRESAENLRIATEAARMFKWEFDFQKQLYTFADSFAQVLGFSAGLLPQNSAETVRRLSPKEDVQIISEAIAQAVQNHSDLNSLQYRVINPEDGQTVWLEVNARIVYDDRGAPLRMFGVAQNITNEKNAKEEIRILSKLPEENPNPVMRLTPEGIVLYANKPSQDLLEVWKQQVDQAIPDELKRQVAESFASGRKKEIEITQTGRTFSCMLAPIREAGYVNVYGTDITERKQTERVVAEFARQQQALYQLSDQLHHTNSLEDVYNAALDAILRGLQCERASILLFDDSGVMRFVAWRGLSEAYRKATEGHSPWQADEKNPYPVCVGDVQASDLSDFLKETIQKEGIASLAFIPLVSNGKLIGKFMVYFDTRHDCSDNEIELGLMIARQLAFGIDRKRAEMRLRESEEALEHERELLNRIFESIPVMLTIYDPSTNLLRLNKQFEQLIGWKSEETAGISLMEACYPDSNYREEVWQFMDRGAENEWMDIQMRTRDGRTLETSWSNIQLSNEMRVGIGIDITERKYLEEQLRARQAELAAIINQTPFMLTRCTRDLHYRFVSRAYAEMIGRTPEEIEGKPIVEIMGEEGLRTISPYIEKVLQGEQVEYESEVPFQDAVTPFLHIVYTPDRDETGNVIGWFASIIDIGERKQAEEKLRASEALYRTIARSIPGGGVYVVDKDFRYLVSEGPVTDAFGLSRASLEGKTVWEAFPDERGERMRERLQRTYEGEIVNFETEYNGHVYWTQQAPLRDSIGQAIIVTIDITERKRAEEALRQSEERFARFMYHLPGLAWIKDMQGRYVYANAAAEKAFKTPREKLYGRTDTDIFPPGVADQFKENDERALVNERGLQTIETLPQEDGVLHYSLVTKFSIPDSGGAAAWIGGTAFDITERLQAEEALRESEERFRAILRQATAGIVRKDSDGRFIFVNQAFCNMLGYSESELLGKTVWEFMHEDDIAENKRSFERLMMQSLPFKLERRFLRKDGSIIWVDASVSPVTNADGKPQSAVAVEVDITGRKQAENDLHQLNQQLESRVQKRTATIQAMNQSLRDEIAERKRVEEALRVSEATARASEEKLRTLFDLLPVGISFLDPQGRIIEMNSALPKILRLSKEQLFDQEYVPRQYIRADGTPMPRAEFAGARALAENRTVYNVEVGVILENSETLWISVSAAPVDVADVGVVVVTVDITDHKRAEQALQESHTRLRVLSQRLVEVQEEERRALARELHDRVGQTLAALNINLIIISGQLSPEAAQQIGARLNDSMKLVGETIALVRDVMTDLRPAVLDDYGLQAALDSHVSGFKARYNIQVQFERPDRPLPRLGPSIEMTFLRIAQEALMNIAKHAHAKHIHLSLREVDESICLTIQDDGIGIASWQDANRPGSHGLTIMRERAEAFGGTLKVKSVPGQGTILEASIPFKNDSHDKVQKENA